ncbi:MAG: WecB/TagA/CpsF family glycosyltransferase [Pseudomonadales bacterium]
MPLNSTMTESIAIMGVRPSAQMRRSAVVLGNAIDAISMEQVSNRIIDWAREKVSRTVILCNVHSTVSSADDTALKNALDQADVVLPDGAPIAWMLRRKGFASQRRVAGPDLMLNLLEKVNGAQLSVFLFGSTDETLNSLVSVVRSNYPNVTIAGTLSPAYGDWTEAQNLSYVNAINQSGASICFVGLGCTKQEIWMTEKKDYINSVMLGLGAAFDFNSGTLKRAPLSLQKAGLEWLHRLVCEPRRLFNRYFVTNSKFLVRASLELLRH